MSVKNKNIGSDVIDDLKQRLKDTAFEKDFNKIRTKVAIGQMIKRITDEKKLSVRQLANKMGSSLSQVQRLMKDKNVTIDTLAKFATATGKKLDIILK